LTPRKKVDPLELVAKLAAEERRLYDECFVAPVVGGGRVRVRVSGIVYELSIPGAYTGWSILKIKNQQQAQVIEPATPAVVLKYLRLFPRIRMVALQPFQNRWWAIAASGSDTRIKLSGPAPMQLVASCSRFDTVNCRFDGSVFWFESIDRRRDPRIAKTLNKALAEGVEPAKLQCLGATPEERLAYRMLWLDEHEETSAGESDLERINRALAHAGANLEGFSYQGGDRATVRFTVDGMSRSVLLQTSDLSVISAGICLSGMDHQFDLTSLVGVWREAAETGNDFD